MTTTTATAAAAAVVDVAALVAAAADRKATATPSRSRRLAYGVFATPCGHVVAVMYGQDGRELPRWELLKVTDGKGTRVGIFPRKVDALNYLDAQAAAAAAPAAE